MTEGSVIPEAGPERAVGRTTGRTADPVGRTRPAWKPVLVVTAVAVAVHLAVATRYGWFGDEFYYVICGRHPAWGYVDQPPLAPMLARAAAAVPLDGGLLPLRVLAIAAQAGCIVLGAVLAAEWGGGRRAQSITAAAVAGCPVFVGAAMLFGTTVLDQLAWAALFVLVARALRIGTTRSWLAAGLVAGIGLENKDTVAVLLVGIAVGLAVCRPDVLRTRGPWVAAALALLIALPNLIWDASNGWPNLSMDKALSGEQGGPLGALLELPELPLLFGGLLLAGLWWIGMRHLRSAQQRGDRWVLFVALVAVVVFTLGGGKPYYAAPAILGLFAAGAVRIERLDTRRGRRTWPALLGLSAVTSTLSLLPVLPVGFANAERGLNPDLMQTYGWQQLAAQAANAAAPLPADAPIFTSDYEEAGALTILGPAMGLDRPVYSGHNNYTLWGPPPGRSQTVLVIGSYTPTQLQQLCTSSSEIAPYTLPDGLTNDDIARHVAFYLCQGPKGTWAQLWPQLKHFD